MIRFTPFGGLLAASVLVALASKGVHGSQIAYDSAGDSAYSNGWTQGSNGGFGWGSGWILSSPSTAQMRSSSTNPISSIGATDGIGDINSPQSPDGRSWDLGSQPATATRLFSGPLAVGQTFSLDFESDHAGNVNTWDWIFLNNAGTNIFALDARDGFYGVAYGAGGTDTGIPVTEAGVHAAFTRMDKSYSVALTPFEPGATTSVFTIPYTGDVDSFALGTSTGIAPYGSAFANNLAVTPEPGCMGLLAVGLAGSLLRRRPR